VTRIARVTGLDHVGIAVSVAIRPLSQTLSVSQGKGTSPELADVSAVMESIELWHSENAPAAELSGSYFALSRQGHPVVDPVGLRPAGVFPRAVDLRTRPSGWLGARSLVSGEPRFVPRYQCAITMADAIPEQLTTHVSSTGLAGGNTLDEATCHALAETIERDATARFEELSEAERQDREIDIATVTGPARRLIEDLDTAGLRTRVWDQTSPVGVPAFSCTLDGIAELRGLPRFAGFGAHLDPEIAISRAVSEAVQSRLTVISGARDDQTPADYAAMQLAAGRPASEPRGRRSFNTVPKSQTTGAFASDVRVLVDRLCAAGFEDVLRVDLTHPDIGVPVAFVFVPSAKGLLE